MHLKKLNIIYSTLFIYWSNNLVAQQCCAWLSSNALNLFSGQHGTTLSFPSGESKSLQVQAWEHSPKKKREGSRSFQTCKDGSLEAFAQKEKRSAEAQKLGPKPKLIGPGPSFGASPKTSPNLALAPTKFFRGPNQSRALTALPYV